MQLKANGNTFLWHWITSQTKKIYLHNISPDKIKTNLWKSDCVEVGSLVSRGEVSWNTCFTWFPKELHPIRCDLGEPEPVLTQTRSLYHTEASNIYAAASHLWLNSTSTTLGSARVERSPRSFSLRAICRRTLRMILPAGRVKSLSLGVKAELRGETENAKTRSQYLNVFWEALERSGWNLAWRLVRSSPSLNEKVKLE